MRNVLAGGLCAAVAAAPAVALAATNDENESTVNDNVQTATELGKDARYYSARDRAAERRRKARERRRGRLAKRRHAASTRRAPAPAIGGGSTASPALQAIAACESGGNASAVGGGGAYRGKYQFDSATWASVGGSGDPAAAPEAEQDRRAAMLYARAGASSWPVCGR